MRTFILFSLLIIASTVMAQAPPTTGTDPAPPATPPDQVVMTVNGDPVHAHEVQLAAQHEELQLLSEKMRLLGYEQREAITLHLKGGLKFKTIADRNPTMLRYFLYSI